MSVQIKLFKTQYDLEPWKLLAIGLGAGAGVMAAAVGLLTLILKH